MFTNSFAPSQREFVVAYFVAFIICTSYQANAILISDALNSFCIRNIVNEFTDCRTISSLCIVGVVYIVGSKCKAELCSVIQPSCTAFASQLCIVVSILVQTYIVASCQESLCSVAFQTDICGVDSRVTINLRSNSRSGLLTSLYKGSRFIRTICLILTKYPFERVTFVRNRCGGCGYSRRSSSRCSRSGCNSFCCGCFSTRCSCSSGCGFASVRNLNNQLAVYISCLYLGVVQTTPFKQLTLLVVQLFPFENQREFIVSTVFIAVLQFQTICFCNALNSCFIRNVVVQCEECSTIRNFAAQNLCCAGRRNAPSKALRVFFPLTEVYECINCIIRLISVAVCIQQCQCCCTFVIGLECNGDTFGIRYIVQVQRDFCIFLFRCYDNLVVLLLAICFTVNFHSRCSRVDGRCGCACSCGCACGRCSGSGIFHLYDDATVYISCCDLGVVYATPFKQLALLVVQLFPFENQREFIVSTVFIAVLQFQTICFCNALNSCFIRNVVVQCEECSTIRNFAAQNLCCAGRRNAPSKALRVFFPLTEVYECIDCIVRLISVAVCIQQCQSRSTFPIGLKCNGDTFGIRYIVQVQRNFCIFLTRCYNNLVILLLAICFTVNFHSRCSRVDGRCGCACSRSYACSRGSLRIGYLDNQVAVYISCLYLGVVQTTPFQQLTLLVVQLFPFKNKREFIVSTIFIVVLQFQTICFCNALNSCFIRNVVVQCEECSTIRNFAAQNLCCAGRRNAPSKALRVFFPLTEVYECINCIIRLISVAVCIQQCQSRCTFVIGLECNSDTFGIRYLVQVQRDFCIFLFWCYNDIFTLIDCHCRAINHEFCFSCSSS